MNVYVFMSWYQGDMYHHPVGTVSVMQWFKYDDCVHIKWVAMYDVAWGQNKGTEYDKMTSGCHDNGLSEQIKH